MRDDLEQKIAARYRQASTEQPPAALDRTVLDTARKAVEPRAHSPFGNHWMAGGAMAAVVVLSAILVLVTPEQTDMPALEEGVTESTVDRAPAMAELESHHQDEKLDIGSAPMPEQESRQQREKLDIGPAPKANDLAAPAKEHAAKKSAPPPVAAEPKRELMPERTQPRLEMLESPAKTAPLTPAGATTESVQPTLQKPDRRSEPARQDQLKDLKAYEAPAETKPGADFYSSEPDREADVTVQGMRERAVVAGKAMAPESLYLQTSELHDRDTALQLQARILKLGYAAEIKASTDDAGQTVYRLQIGPFTNTDAREQAMQALQKKEIQTELVTDKGTP